MIFPPHFFISTFISMVSLAHYKIDYKSPLTLYPRWCSWVVYPHCVVSLLSYHTASLSSSYTRRISSYNKCVCILIIIIVIIFIVIVIVVSSSSSSLLSYPRCMHCRRQLANLALFIFLPRHVRTMSWPHYKVASCHPALLCARATTACIPFYRSSSLLLSFVPTVTSSSYSWLLCHSCRVCVIHVSHPPEDDSLPPTNNIYAARRR
jgi:hypothetical protein